MAETTRKRSGELIRKLFEILTRNPDGVPASKALDLLSKEMELTEFEKSYYPQRPDVRRFEKIVRFSTIGPVKAGWMQKNKGQWTITEEGKAAYSKFMDPADFMRQAAKLYRQWRKEQPEEDDQDVEDDGSPGPGATLEQSEEAAWTEIQEYLSEMNPYDFQDLVAGLLRGMGYHVSWVSPPGADKGVDVILQRHLISGEIREHRMDATGPELKTIRTPLLEIAYEEWGSTNGHPVILLHGFPDDVHAWDQVAPRLAEDGYRIIVPYLRGYGPTRFLQPSTPRIGQQAALGQDVLDFMDALSLPKATLAGYDWGCTAACVASVLQPERVNALVAIHGYGIGDTVTPEPPAPPTEERECWYHWYFQIERGRRGLETNRKEICLLLWRSWSPNWKFDKEEFSQTAKSFDNPDFVSVVINNYRHSHGNALGDSSYAEQEQRLVKMPPITVPSIVLHGEEDTVHPLHRSLPQMHLFPKGTRRKAVPGAGHFVPREKPNTVVEEIRTLLV